MPLISVIVPVYNTENYLVECIDSILNQTVHDFEIIIVNDGSKDQSGVVCDYLALKDSRIHVIHQDNQGQAVARNHAFEISRGEWIHYVDSDDVIHPQMLELLLSGVTSMDSKLSMCGLQSVIEPPKEFVPLEGSFGGVLHKVDEEFFCTLTEGVWEDEGIKNDVPVSKLIHRSIIARYPFCPGRIYEDTEVACKWIVSAERVSNFSQKIYYYRNNPNSTVNRAFSEKLLDRLWLFNQLEAYYQSINYLVMAENAQIEYCMAAYTLEEAAKKNPTENRKIIVQLKRLRQKKLLKNYLTWKSPVAKKRYILQLCFPRMMKYYWTINALAKRFLHK